MRDRGVLALVLLGVAPLLLIGGAALARTVSDVRDPCMTWGTSWDSYQEGGGSSGFRADGAPADPRCPEGTRWTTEAPGHALVENGSFGAAALVGLVAGLAAWRTGVAWPVILVAPLLFVVSWPLGLGVTIVIAGLPAAAFVAAARHLPQRTWETWALRAFGLVVAAMFLAFLAQALVAVVSGEMPKVALVGAALGGTQFALVAGLALWPRRGEAALRPAMA